MLIFIAVILILFAIGFFIKAMFDRSAEKKDESIAKMGTNKNSFFILTGVFLVLAFSLTGVNVYSLSKRNAFKDPIEYFDPKEIGDFIYAGGKNIYNNEVYIIGLSKTGKKKNTIIFPEILKNYHVRSLGAYISSEFTSGVIEINAKNVYYPNYYYENQTLKIKYGSNVDNVFITSKEIKVYIDSLVGSHRTFYLSTKEYQKTIDSGVNYYKYYTDRFKIANVEYYKDKTDEYPFFIDDVDGTKIKNKAPTPYLEGYEFVDWYKDENLTEKWGFENDIVPEKQYEEDGIHLLQTTKLYAKWNKIAEQ